MPISLATWATTGAAPVPVPPPMPAVMNSMSAPSITSMMRSRSSSAACRPTSGLAPAPSPLVMPEPSCSATRADVLQRLGIGIGADELHTLDVGLHHVLHGVAAAAADTDDLDHCVLTVCIH
jgi:hypothetical protein